MRLDGKPVEELIREFGKDMGFGNQKAARRLAAQRLVIRVQAVMPNAPDTPETSEAVFRNQAGDLKTYTLKWIKQGTPIENMSPLPSPFTLNSERDPLEVIRKLQNWRWEPDKPASIKKPTLPERQQWGGTQYLQQQGRLPVFNAPPGWRLRLGAGPNDVFVSGTYTYEGKRMGLIRIADFDPPSRVDAVRQMEAEIAFFKANTDGLVVDLMGNAGGDCIGLDYAKLLIPERFWFFGAQVLANRYWLYEAESALQAAIANDAEPWVIETIAFYADEIRNALKGNRAMTGSIPACQPTQSAQPAAPTFEHDPARAADGTLLAYDKPVIFLVDEFSASFGDVFPGMMQDNRRGLIVGTRTAGLGGAVISSDAGFYGEGKASVTISMVVRRQDMVTTEFPTAPYIENIGVRPDRELDYMTRENLLRGGTPFVQAFSRILAEQIDRIR
ncbi:MAG: S41 family peptidase [Acidobacteriota bacterium]